MEVKNKNIGIIGMGVTGIATAHFILNRGGKVTAYDQKPGSNIKGIDDVISKITLFDNWDGFTLNNNELVIVSPGVPMSLEAIQSAKQKGIEVISEVEFAYRFTDKPIIGVTGTNGKSTTVTLLGQMLNNADKKVGVGGNLGTPFIQLVQDDNNYEMYLLELSSYQLEGIVLFKPWMAVLLNITEDHLDRYEHMSDYVSAKFRIFMNQSVDDYAIINAQDPYVVRNKKSIRARPYCFTTSKRTRRGAYYKDGKIMFVDGSGHKTIFTINNESLRKIHNVENTMACIIVSKLLDVPNDVIQKSIDNFKGLAHRIELVGEFNGIKYFDDSKATNVDAVVVALKSIPKPIILIMGGRDKQGDYNPLSLLIKEKVKLLIVMGEAKERIKNAFQKIVKTVSVDSMESAVKAAVNNAMAGDSVLLSPACSSFDMFNDYKQRGDVFKSLVIKLNRGDVYERL